METKKTVIVTGASQGIGAGASRSLIADTMWSQTRATSRSRIP
jgi:NAD(P)-dependent dehydrogenase (short-subunit alcohol dehydrogenase family)